MKFIKLKKTYIFGGFLENSMLPDISISVFRNVFMIGQKVIFLITILYYSRETIQQYFYIDCIR